MIFWLSLLVLNFLKSVGECSVHSCSCPWIIWPLVDSLRIRVMKGIGVPDCSGQDRIPTKNILDLKHVLKVFFKFSQKNQDFFIFSTSVYAWLCKKRPFNKWNNLDFLKLQVGEFTLVEYVWSNPTSTYFTKKPIFSKKQNPLNVRTLFTWM